MIMGTMVIMVIVIMMINMMTLPMMTKFLMTIMQGEWKGAGAHTNFSTSNMREDNGIIEIEVGEHPIPLP